MTGYNNPNDKASSQVFESNPELSSASIWARSKRQEPQCGFGTLGICCTICNLGPCRIDPFGEGASEGVCGATADTITARNLVRQIAAGSSAHSDHGRELVLYLSHLADQEDAQDRIKDCVKLLTLAEELGIKTRDVAIKDIMKSVSNELLKQFTRHEGVSHFIQKAPAKRRESWEKAGIIPGGIDREIVETFHRTNMGVDNNFESLLLYGMKVALNDGWGGSMIATELTDIIFGSPQPVRAQVNLGVMKKDHVNILIHGHEPIFAHTIADMAQDSSLLEEAKNHGAKGIQVAGICCTASELLMRKGIPVAGSFLQQELALMTGAVDMMIVNYQCVLPSLPAFARCLHSRIATTSPKAQFPGMEYINVEESPEVSARNLIKQAIEAFQSRKDNNVFIPSEIMDVVAGFTSENIHYHLGGLFRGSYRPLNDNIANGRIRGVAAVVGCDNPRMRSGDTHVQLVKELIRQDVLVIQTGCAATACAKSGLLKPEAAFQFAGPGLKEVCEAVGIPPVLHNGACVDNSRILVECCEMVKEGGLGDDISDLPVAAAAPEWISEKAITIGWYAVASGVYTVLGTPLRVAGSPTVNKYICEDLEKIVGGKFAFESDPVKIANLMVEHMNKKREKLKLKPAKQTGTYSTVSAGD